MYLGYLIFAFGIAWFFMIANFIMEATHYTGNTKLFHLINSCKVFAVIFIGLIVFSLPFVVLIKIGFITCNGQNIDLF